MSARQRQRDSATRYLLGLRDPATGGFRFCAGLPTTLQATGFAILGLELLGGLSRLDRQSRAAVADFLCSGRLEDGSFREPLLRRGDLPPDEEDYFHQQTTCFCQQALDALGGPPPPPRQLPEEWTEPVRLIRCFDQLAWRDPWRDSNRVMFTLAQICHEIERHERDELGSAVDAALDWLDAHQSPQTGLWSGRHETSLLHAMATTFHFTFFYPYRGRRLRHAEAVIDSCLALQQPDGLFAPGSVGQSCLDYDAIDLLVKAATLTDHRAGDVKLALRSARRALHRLTGPDGGFTCHREKRVGGRRAAISRTLRLEPVLPGFSRVRLRGTYSAGWHLLTVTNGCSDAFSTWFRQLAIELIARADGPEPRVPPPSFRRLPFLGHARI